MKEDRYWTKVTSWQPLWLTIWTKGLRDFDVIWTRNLLIWTETRHPLRHEVCLRTTAQLRPLDFRYKIWSTLSFWSNQDSHIKQPVWLVTIGMNKLMCFYVWLEDRSAIFSVNFSRSQRTSVIYRSYPVWSDNKNVAERKTFSLINFCDFKNTGCLLISQSRPCKFLQPKIYFFFRRFGTLSSW